jgi:hypothetical protein
MPGTYIAVRVKAESERLIREFMELYNVPIVYPNLEKRRHVTLISSDDDIVDEFNQLSCNPLLKFWAMPKAWDVFPTREGNRCLVLKIDCPTLVKRHDDILSAYKIKDRYDEYKCHISFSYDIEDYDISQLPAFQAPIILDGEYCETFNMNWVRKDN